MWIVVHHYQGYKHRHTNNHRVVRWFSVGFLVQILEKALLPLQFSVFLPLRFSMFTTQHGTPCLKMFHLEFKSLAKALR